MGPDCGEMPTNPAGALAAACGGAAPSSASASAIIASLAVKFMSPRVTPVSLKVATLAAREVPKVVPLR